MEADCYSCSDVRKGSGVLTLEGNIRNVWTAGLYCEYTALYISAHSDTIVTLLTPGVHVRFSRENYLLLIYVVEITSPISSDPCSAYEKLVLRILFCNQLEEKKRDIENRIEANTRWTAGFDTDLGPFEQLYRSQTQEIASILSLIHI